MSIIIITITIILYLILLGFTWHNLDAVDSKLKVAYILIGTILMAVITLIVFNISKSNVEYQNSNMISNMRNMLVVVFTPINGLIVMPYVANMLGKISVQEITQEKFKKKAIVITLILVTILIFECGYLKDIQLGILDMINR